MSWLKRLANIGAVGGAVRSAARGLARDVRAADACGGKAPAPEAPRAAEAGAPARVWAIGGGKGGVGKSFVAANFGALLAERGNRVLLADADLGAANLHTFFGLDGSRVSLSSYLKNEVAELHPIIGKTAIENLDIITGAKDSLDAADIRAEGIERLMRGLRGLSYSHCLIDVGPGTSANVLDIFLGSDEGILLTTPEPTSIENTYRFLKCLFLRRIREISNSRGDDRLKGVLRRIFSAQWQGRIRTVADIVAEIRRLDRQSAAYLREMMGRTSVSLIVNRAERPEDSSIGREMARACRDYFGMEIRLLGDIPCDGAVGASVRQRRPLSAACGEAEAISALSACLGRVNAPEANRARVFHAAEYNG